jgi:molybdenum cofactor guanylyltransferase
VTDRTTQVAGFVLAGGGSSRMGRDKALLELDGVPMLVRTAHLLEAVSGCVAVIGGAEAYEGFGVAVVADKWPGAGPLGGIATALSVAELPWSLVVACDLPNLGREWLEYLVERALRSRADAVLPMNVLGAEPLCAMYHKRAEPAIREALARGTRKVTDGLEGLRIETIEPAEWKVFPPEGALFKNMNAPSDYEEAKGRFENNSATENERKTS